MNDTIVYFVIHCFRYYENLMNRALRFRALQWYSAMDYDFFLPNQNSPNDKHRLDYHWKHLPDDWNHRHLQMNWLFDIQLVVARLIIGQAKRQMISMWRIDVLIRLNWLGLPVWDLWQNRTQLFIIFLIIIYSICKGTYHYWFCCQRMNAVEDSRTMFVFDQFRPPNVHSN